MKLGPGRNQGRNRSRALPGAQRRHSFPLGPAPLQSPFCVPSYNFHSNCKPKGITANIRYGPTLHSPPTHAGRTLTVPPAPSVVLLFKPSVTARPAPSSVRDGLPDSGAPPSMREGLLDSGAQPSSAPPAPAPAPASDGIQCSCASEGVAGGSSRLAARMSSASAAVPLVSEASSDSTRRHVCGDGPQSNRRVGV